MKFNAAKLDEAYPTIVRYVGLVATLVIIGFCLAGYTTQAAPFFVAAAGLVFYKTIKNAARESTTEEDNDEGDKKS